MKLKPDELKKKLPPVFEAEEALALATAYGDPQDFLMRITNNKELIRLRRGLYADARYIDHFLIANRLLSPSYVSYETALSHYGMIPERVLTIMSVTTQKNRSYSTEVGLFEFYAQNLELFASGYRLEAKDDYYIRIATPEKALFDTVSRMKIVARSLKRDDALRIATDELRIEEASLRSLSKKEIKRISLLYHSGAVRQLGKFILELK